MLAAERKSEAPLIRRSPGRPVSTATSSMRSTRRWMKSPRVRGGAATPRQVGRVAAPQSAAPQRPPLAHARQPRAQRRGQQRFADAALAPADGPDPTGGGGGRRGKARGGGD